jgi:hypothetical protein
VRYIPIALLLEAARLRRTAYRSGRRELLGVETRRGIIGFEQPGERKIAPQRKRPEKFQSLLNRTMLRSKTQSSRYW